MLMSPGRRPSPSFESHGQASPTTTRMMPAMIRKRDIAKRSTRASLLPRATRLLFEREPLAPEPRAQAVELLEQIGDQPGELRIRLELALERAQLLRTDKVAARERPAGGVRTGSFEEHPGADVLDHPFARDGTT